LYKGAYKGFIILVIEGSLNYRTTKTKKPIEALQY
jgi:hypothetical protein